MTLQRILIASLLVAILTSCAPVITSTPSETPQPASTLTSVPTVTETITPTAAPTISLPVDRFQAIPKLSQITSENISDLQPVASYSDAQLISVEATAAGDRILAAFNTGLQVYDLPDLQAKPFLPLDLRGEFQISPDARYVAVIPSEEREQLVIWDLESQTKTCTLSFEGPIARRFSSGPLLLDFFPETNRFIFSGRAGPEGPTTSNNQIRLIDLENCQVIFEMNPRLWPILAVSPDGRYVAYSQDDPSGTIRRAYLFDTQEKSEEMVGDDLNLAGLGF
ncbi:MAG TPA: hypothetical protein VFY25_16250, partial [Anaerolineales bacterium]|nr:hypothetical protein [Anaerolineales bacterium]